MCKEVKGVRELGSGRIKCTACHGNKKDHGNEELTVKMGQIEELNLKTFRSK